ncbi:MAG: hypothetical protein QM757_08730 [Paludibaculum sp.]
MLLNEPHPLEVKVLTRRYKYPQKDPIWLEQYVADEGYAAIRKALTMQPEEIIEEVKKSSLRGRGGAGFPTGLKWSFVDRKSPKPKYIVVNGDEGEPGTCKDRIIMGHEPHRLIEGCLIAGRAIGSNRGWVYIRGEYREYIDIMDRAIQEAYDKGYLGDNVLGSGCAFHLSTHTGAGSYECGEEPALLESLEGKRGNPRLKPPFPATSGAFQAPTIVNSRDLQRGAGDHSEGRRVVRGARYAAQRRYAPGVLVGSSQQAGCVRSAAGHEHDDAHQ